MIFVLQMHSGVEPGCWFAYDQDDLLRKIASTDDRQDFEIHDCVSARELLDMLGSTPEAHGAAEAYPAVWAMASRHGWDVPLYRADYLLEPGTYRTEPVDTADACAAALRDRGDCRIYWTESEATAAFERADDAAWQPTAGGWRARWALREQLIALEVLADDL